MLEPKPAFLPGFNSKNKPSNGTPPRFDGKQTNAKHFEPILEAIANKYSGSSETSVPYSSSAVCTDSKPEAIVFLDIDGVCWVDLQTAVNPKLNDMKADLELMSLIEKNIDHLQREYRFNKAEWLLWLACWDQNNVERLSKLCTEFNAKIVFTSTWRNSRTFVQMQNIASVWGLDAIGKTRDDTLSEKLLMPDRAVQINEYLEQFNLKGIPFVVIDDQHEHTLSKFGDKFVHCDSNVAFDHAQYIEAKNKLQKQFEERSKLESFASRTKKRLCCCVIQ